MGARENSLLSTLKLFKHHPTLPHCPTKIFPQWRWHKQVAHAPVAFLCQEIDELYNSVQQGLSQTQPPQAGAGMLVHTIIKLPHHTMRALAPVRAIAGHWWPLDPSRGLRYMSPWIHRTHMLELRSELCFHFF